MFTPKLIVWSVGLALAGLAIVPTGTRAQQQTAPPPAATPRPPVVLTPEMQERQKLTQEDHQRLMDLLHMTTIRRGRDGNNKDSPFYANYDEAKANPFPKLPDPLVLKNGKPVNDRRDVVEAAPAGNRRGFRPRDLRPRCPRSCRRSRGRSPKPTDETVGDVPVITKTLVGHVDNSALSADHRGHSG